MHKITDGRQHHCCECGERIQDVAYWAREKRGNRAEVCSPECVAQVESRGTAAALGL